MTADKPPPGYLSLNSVVAKIITLIRKHADKPPHVMVGPHVQLNGDHYFIIATAKTNDFWCFQIKVPKPDADLVRSSLITALLAKRPIVVQSFDDELSMAQWCASAWPSDKTRRIRDNLIKERAANPGGQNGQT